MNILITGGNGFVGSNLTVALLKLGHSVAVYDNYSSSTDGTVQSLCNANNAPTDKLSVICGDVVDAIHIKAVTLAFNPDIIFHLAAELSIYDCNNDPYKAVNVNVIGSMNIYLAAISVGAKVIFAESSAVYEACELPFTEDKASPVTTYACSKLSAAIMANGLSKTHGLRYNALRYFNITGEGIDYNRTVTIVRRLSYSYYRWSASYYLW